MVGLRHLWNCSKSIRMFHWWPGFTSVLTYFTASDESFKPSPAQFSLLTALCFPAYKLPYAVGYPNLNTAFWETVNSETAHTANKTCLTVLAQWYRKLNTRQIFSLTLHQVEESKITRWPITCEEMHNVPTKLRIQAHWQGSVNEMLFYRLISCIWAGNGSILLLYSIENPPWKLPWPLDLRNLLPSNLWQPANRLQLAQSDRGKTQKWRCKNSFSLLFCINALCVSHTQESRKKDSLHVSFPFNLSYSHILPVTHD